MNTDPKKSATFCGCDEGANYLCERHQRELDEHSRWLTTDQPGEDDVEIQSDEDGID